jgi:hypothetical protein
MYEPFLLRSIGDGNALPDHPSLPPDGTSFDLQERLSERKSFRQQGSANSIGPGPIEPAATTEEAWPPHPRAQFGPIGR